jgi:hypothetical protein
MSAAQDTQDVVLRGRDSPSARHALRGSVDAIRRAHEVQQGFLSGAGEWTLLSDFVLQLRH